MQTPKGAKDLRETIRMLERCFGMLDERQTSGCGVNFPQCHAIVEIGRAASISLNDLAAILDLDKSTMSRTINALVENGLVDRIADPEDRRFVSISLTKEGTRKFKAIEARSDRYYASVYDSIPIGKRRVVLEGLECLVKAIKESDESPCSSS